MTRYGRIDRKGEGYDPYRTDNVIPDTKKKITDVSSHDRGVLLYWYVLSHYSDKDDRVLLATPERYVPREYEASPGVYKTIMKELLGKATDSEEERGIVFVKEQL